ncbi:MAG: hypothetical protein LPK85_10120 [Gammaproteobacteria bacterium]|nr:hypothetical protein [Gammaproteobacteria bacterium]
MTDEKDEFTRYREQAQARTVQDTLASFLDKVLEITQANRADVNPSHGFWQYRPSADFPPRAIRFVQEYQGADRLQLACTQTDLKPAAQKKLVQDWCQVLPALDKVEYLWLTTRVPQELFDAAVRLKNLKGLYIKWSGIKNIESIAQAQKLRYLHIGSSPSLEPLSALAQLPHLEWLELENVRVCRDLSFVTTLAPLKGLAITGDLNSSKYLDVQTLTPLVAQRQLYWLRLSAVRAEDGDLLPLAKLRALKYLFLSNRYELDAFARLAGARPDLECDLLAPASEPTAMFACKKCGAKQMVMLTGKGEPWACLDCDARRIQRNAERFNEIAASYRFWSDKR